MSDMAQGPTGPKVPTRVGIILGDLGKLNVTALKYLIVHINTLQRSVEFEIIAIDAADPLLLLLKHNQTADRDACRAMLPSFQDRVVKHVITEAEEYDLVDRAAPDAFVVISLARFSDEHYGLKSKNVQIQALGNWDRGMAPPSILEFIVTFLMRQSASFVSPSVSKSVHLGTKGCLFDFTADLKDARYKALQAFVCSLCREHLAAGGAPELAEDLLRVLDTRWFGATSDPNCPAGIVANLGYDLFLTQGIKPTVWERLRSLLLDEGTKELLKLAGGIALVALLLWLNLKPGK